MARSKRIQPADIPVVILAGGRGARLMEETVSIPKPMTLIGNKPILLHIMQYYRAFGFRQFYILLGYKGHVIKEYFLNIHKYVADVRIKGAQMSYEYDSATLMDMDINLVETGEHSLTGTRLARTRLHLDGPHFCLTYGDGLSDIDLKAELDFHLRHGRLCTMAAVHPPARFGVLKLNAHTGRALFEEKGRARHDYINGGFMIFRREFLRRLPAAGNYSLEGELLARLGGDGQLYCFRHEGYWQCMDTMRDRETLEETYLSGKAPWTRPAPSS